MVGITKPLALRFYTDPTQPRKVGADGNASFTIQRSAFVAAGQEIVDDFEQTLAWFFLRYGMWDDLEQIAEIVNGEIIYFDFQGMKQDPNPDQPFLMIGQLSQMITHQFNEKTVDEGNIRRLTPDVQPDKLGIMIPNGFKGKVLGLWRFRLRTDSLS
jgi:hypothetical protein